MARLGPWLSVPNERAIGPATGRVSVIGGGASTAANTADSVMMAPVVIQLDDDNCDQVVVPRPDIAPERWPAAASAVDVAVDDLDDEADLAAIPNVVPFPVARSAGHRR